MTEKEKENRIHSLALSFLGRQQIVPNLYADQIIRGYKEGYHQAEKDLKVKEVDLEKHLKEDIEDVYFDLNGVAVKGATYYLMVEDIKEIAKHFFELGLKAQKGETELSKVKGFLVRDKDDYTAIYAEKPHRGKTEWVDGNDSCLMTINDARLVPDIEFEEEPVEVEVTLKRLKAKGKISYDKD